MILIATFNKSLKRIFQKKQKHGCYAPPFVLRVVEDQEEGPQRDEGEEAHEPEEHRHVQLVLVVNLPPEAQTDL